MADSVVYDRYILARHLRELGVEPGDVLVVHSSFRAVGPVEGGPTALILALMDAVGPEGTLVMPSMTDRDDELFDPKRTPCRHLGIVPDTFWRMPGGTAKRFAPQLCGLRSPCGPDYRAPSAGLSPWARQPRGPRVRSGWEGAPVRRRSYGEYDGPPGRGAGRRAVPGTEVLHGAAGRPARACRFRRNRSLLPQLRLGRGVAEPAGPRTPGRGRERPGPARARTGCRRHRRRGAKGRSLAVSVSPGRGM